MAYIVSSPRPLALALAATLLVGSVGCRENSESLTEPGPAPALKITPAPVLSFRRVSAGYGHTCGVTTDNRAYCWGLNNSGQLGDGTGTTSPTPVPVAGGLRFRHVSAGFVHTCGVTTDDRAYCWGENSAGELGNGTTTNSLTSVAVTAPL